MNRNILFVWLRDKHECYFTNMEDLDRRIDEALIKISKVTHKPLSYGLIDIETNVEYEDLTWPEPIGTQTVLSGKSIYQILDKIDSNYIAPIVCFIVSPLFNKKLINVCYKTLNKYGVVNCMVVKDEFVSDYIFHELVHAIHEVIARQGVRLPDTQDQDVLGVGNSSTPAHQKIVAENLLDCVPHIDLLDKEPLQWKLAFAKSSLVILLLEKVIALMKLLPRKKDNKYWIGFIKDMAKKYGVDQTTLLATIYAESGFEPRAVGSNVNGTKDYGICQINDYWWIGSNSRAAMVNQYYFPSSDYVLDNPEKCIEWMAIQWQKGRQRDWCAYSNGAYKKYLTMFNS